MPAMHAGHDDSAPAAKRFRNGALPRASQLREGLSDFASARLEPRADHAVGPQQRRSIMKDRKQDPSKLREPDFDSDRMGRNSLQGDDQESVRNERQTMPDEREQADDMEESFRKLDKDARARLDMNKGATRDN
jgi:hypothetical protein